MGSISMTQLCRVFVGVLCLGGLCVGQSSAVAATGWTQLPSQVPGNPTGAAVARDAEGRAYVFGGSVIGHGVVAAAYRFDGTNWAAIAPLPAAITDATAVLGSDRRIYVTGGFDSRFSDQTQTYAYDPATNTWQKRAPLPDSRSRMALVAVGGSIYAIGGLQDGDPWPEVDRYDLASNTWALVAELPVPLAVTAAALGSDGRVYVFGGYTVAEPPPSDPEGNYLGATDRIFRYDPAGNTWATVPLALPTYSALQAAVAINGHVYLAGGVSHPTGSAIVSPEPSIGRVLMFTPGLDAWTCVDPLLPPRAGFNLVANAAGDGIYAIGDSTTVQSLATPAIDTTPPTFPSTPYVKLTAGQTLGPVEVPINVAWQACDDESPVTAYAVAQSSDADPYIDIHLATPTTSAYKESVFPGWTSHQFRITATSSGGGTPPTFTPSVELRSVSEGSTAIRYTGSWRWSAASLFYGSHVRYATSPLAHASLTFRGREIAIVSDFGPARGVMKVSIDETQPSRINLHETAYGYRRIVYTHTFSTLATHTITITPMGRACGTGCAGPTRIDLDDILILQ